MENKLKLIKLWEYLRIQDEILAVQIHNNSDAPERFITIRKIDGELITGETDDLGTLDPDIPLRLIRQRGADGKFEVPSVPQIIEDRLSDY